MNRFAAPALFLALTAAACQGDQAARTTIGAEGDRPGALPAALQAPIDSGNVAFRARDYEEALRHYRQATAMAPDEPTGWFGIVMAADALGNQALADSARAHIDQIAPELNPRSHTAAGHPETSLEPGTTMPPPGHPTPGANGAPGALPQGHP